MKLETTVKILQTHHFCLCCSIVLMHGFENMLYKHQNCSKLFIPTIQITHTEPPQRFLFTRLNMCEEKTSSELLVRWLKGFRKLPLYLSRVVSANFRTNFPTFAGEKEAWGLNFSLVFPLFTVHQMIFSRLRCRQSRACIYFLFSYNKTCSRMIHRFLPF